MKFLLDTHLLLWWLSDDPALGGAAEIGLKQSLGKLRLPAGFEDALSAQAFEDLPLTPAHARELARLPWHHRDPFGRMPAAQARAEGLTLLTADGRLALYGDFVRLVSG